MHRARILGGVALASLMAVMLTGCPSIISNVVSSSESVDQTVKNADSGTTVKVHGTHEEDVDVETDNVTITGDDGATIDGEVIVDANDVTLENITITDELDTVPGSFESLTLNNVVVEAWGNTQINGTFTCSSIVQPGESIQAHIDNSTAGASVCVAPDTYNERLTVDVSDLTLRAFSGPSDTIINPGGGGIYDIGISVRQSDLGTVTVNGFKLTNYGGGGIITGSSDTGTTLHIRNNVITASDAVGKATVQVSGDGSTVIGNDIQAGALGRYPGYEGAGILISANNRGESTDDVIVRNNDVHDGDVGIGVVGFGGDDVVKNTTIENNTVTDSKISINIEKESVNTEIRGNTLRGTDVGVQVEHQDGLNPTGTTLEENQVSGHNQYGAEVRSDASTTVPNGYALDAENNYWGSSEGPQDTNGANEATTANCPSTDIRNTQPAGSLGNGVTGHVNYCPWLTSAN